MAPGNISEQPRGDASKLHCAGAPVAMTKDDMRNLYRILSNAATSLVAEDPPKVRELVHDEVTRAFEMARYGVKINGQVIQDGKEFRTSCESTVGVEPLDERLEREVADLHGDISKELAELMSFRREVPLKMRRTLAKRPIKSHEIKVEVQRPEVDTELVDCAQKSLRSLDDLEVRVKALKAKKNALDHTI